MENKKTSVFFLSIDCDDKKIKVVKEVKLYCCHSSISYPVSLLYGLLDCSAVFKHSSENTYGIVTPGYSFGLFVLKIKKAPP